MVLLRTIRVCLAVILAVVAVGCDGNDRRGNPLFDADGNAYSISRMPDGRLWMTANLNLTVPDSYCHGGMASACLRFGRLYTWASAVEACGVLGTGWRLPTNDEWRRMAKEYGGVLDDSEDGGQAAYMALLRDGGSGFNALLGGSRESDGAYTRMEEHGFYWTASEDGTDAAWFYNFGRGAELLNRHSGGKSMGMSVRCIKASE